MALDLDYIDVAQRIADFRTAHPEGALQPADLTKPYTIERIGDQTYIVVVAAAYRTPDDPKPGVGMAYEVFPGKTNFTRGSELQNAETSAWGRAIVAALAGDTKKSIASAQEVRNRQAERDEQPRNEAPARPKPPTAPANPGAVRGAIAQAGQKLGLSREEIAQEFCDWTQGTQIAECSDAKLLTEFLADLSKRPVAA